MMLLKGSQLTRNMVPPMRLIRSDNDLSLPSQATAEPDLLKRLVHFVLFVVGSVLVRVGTELRDHAQYPQLSLGISKLGDLRRHQ